MGTGKRRISSGSDGAANTVTTLTKPPGLEVTMSANHSTNLRIKLDFNDPESYRLFLRIKALPRYAFQGHTAIIPEEYVALLGLEQSPSASVGHYAPAPFLFDYQSAIAALAVRKRKFAVFAECGLGKTFILSEFARYVADLLPSRLAVLIVSPLMVIRQTIAECRRFYGDALQLDHLRARDLPAWLASGQSRIGITNYEAIVDGLPTDRLGALILDESSLLKSAYGAWGQRLIRMGKGLEWKLCLTGTPAPNDRIEYANHAVFLDQFPTVNSFLARFFVNRGQTGERWELKPHALRPFYRALSHWCIFLTSPATYGWKDNTGNIPPIHVHIEDVPLTDEQREAVQALGGDLYGQAGGITTRSTLSQIAKGKVRDGKKVQTLKPAYIRDRIASWPDESTLVWCLYNAEQDTLEEVMPDAASLRGETPEEERLRVIEDFQAGRLRTLISKPKVLGYGLNLQIATRQVFSGLQDSYELYWQAIKRSNRIGSTRDLNVHIPITDIERPMVETVLAKARRVQEDTVEQEQLFKEVGCGSF